MFSLYNMIIAISLVVINIEKRLKKIINVVIFNIVLLNPSQCIFLFINRLLS